MKMAIPLGQMQLQQTAWRFFLVKNCLSCTACWNKQIRNLQATMTTVIDIYAHGRSPSGIITRCKCNSGTTVQQSSDMRHLNACTAVLDEYMQVQDVVLTVGKTSQKYFRNLLTKLKAQAVA